MRMRRACVEWFLLLIILSLRVGKCVSMPASDKWVQTCAYSGLFSFGDSLADTGNALSAFPEQFSGLVSPYGETFFHRPALRASDGRLVIDFIAQAMGIPYLSPYLKSIGVSYQFGANFAASGGTALPSLLNPFNLAVQFDWYTRFKDLVEDSYGSGTGSSNNMPDPLIFESALYVVSIGGNDYFNAYRTNTSIDEVKTLLVPTVVGEIKNTLESLYQEGARNFLAVNIPAQGCSLFLLQSLVADPSAFDALGCANAYNEVSSLHNEQLKAVVNQLSEQFSFASFVLADYYGINYDVLRYPSKYGIENTMQACCGIGPSQYNVNPDVRCAGGVKLIDGKVVAASACRDPARYVNWDGVHFTEAMYSVVAKAFLTGQFVQPDDVLQKKCAFNVSNFR